MDERCALHLGLHELVDRIEPCRADARLGRRRLKGGSLKQRRKEIEVAEDPVGTEEVDRLRARMARSNVDECAVAGLGFQASPHLDCDGSTWDDDTRHLSRSFSSIR